MLAPSFLWDQSFGPPIRTLFVSLDFYSQKSLRSSRTPSSRINRDWPRHWTKDTLWAFCIRLSWDGVTCTVWNRLFLSPYCMLTNFESSARYLRQLIHYDESRSRHPKPSRATVQHRSIVLFILLLVTSLVALLLTGFLLDIQTLFWFLGPNVWFYYRGTEKFSTENVWVGMKAGEHCLRYATRQYTARISEVRGGDNAMQACKDTPVEIHGNVLFTDFCQNLVRPSLYHFIRFDYCVGILERRLGVLGGGVWWTRMWNGVGGIQWFGVFEMFLFLFLSAEIELQGCSNRVESFGTSTRVSLYWFSSNA